VSAVLGDMPTQLLFIVMLSNNVIKFEIFCDALESQKAKII